LGTKRTRKGATLTEHGKEEVHQLLLFPFLYPFLERFLCLLQVLVIRLKLRPAVRRDLDRRFVSGQGLVAPLLLVVPLVFLLGQHDVPRVELGLQRGCLVDKALVLAVELAHHLDALCRVLHILLQPKLRHVRDIFLQHGERYQLLPQRRRLAVEGNEVGVVGRPPHDVTADGRRHDGMGPGESGCQA
jgi:hypothetical protein